MARNVVLSDLVTRCQRRVDREGDPAIAPFEWKAAISEQYAELVALIDSTGMRENESVSTIAASGAASYPEPSDILSFIGIDYVATNGTRRALRELMVQERNYYAGQVGDAIGFSFVAKTIRLYPNPASGTYELLYVPQPPDLSVAADSTTVDVVVPDGEAFILYGVAVKILSKLEQDPSTAMRERDQARGRVEEWAVLRALNNPRRRFVNRDDCDTYGGRSIPWWYT